MLAVAAVALAAGPASVATGDEAHMQPLLAADGSGLLFANDADGPFTWEACRSDLTGCVPHGTGREVGTGTAPPGTVFRLSSGSRVGLSPIWNGNLAVAVPPSVTGPVRANRLVTPTPATWRGGWVGDFDQTQLSACRSPDGTRCLAITHPKYIGGCKGEATVIDPALTGRYLRVANVRYGPGTAFTLEGYTTPYGYDVWQVDGRTAAAVIGPILPAEGPPTSRCGPPPLNDASISKRGVATVRCALGCRAALIAQRRGRRAARGRHVSTGLSRFSTVEIRVPGLVRRLGPGRARIRVRIQGRTVARRTVFIRPLTGSDR
jgi:hypothetical protein